LFVCLLVLSYNQPNLSLCASWEGNAITFADKNWVGQQPVGIFINRQNAIYVADRENGRVLVWKNGSSTPTRTISGNLTNPWSLFVTIDDTVYVSHSSPSDRIDQWALNVTYSEVVMNVTALCTGLFININYTLYCSLMNNHRVIKVALKSNTTIPSIVAGTGCPGPVANMLDHPSGIFVDIHLNLYVADTQNNRIQFFAPAQMDAITVAGFGALVYFILNRPTGIVLDADGYLFIVDSHNHRIIRSIPNGFHCLVGCSGNSGATLSHLDNPQTMAFDSNGNIFVTDFNNHRIQKFMLTINSCSKFASLNCV
jgi:DNA-binding beta-propeller fold protein YncE